MAMTEFPVGRLDNIEFVAIFTRYQGKWIYCWHKRRKSYEHPGGHVEPGETPMHAAKRELYEETGIKDCKLLPLWDYEYIYEDGKGRNNGRVFYAEVFSLGELPESEMDRIEFFDTVPENYTYDRADEIRDLANVGKMIQAYEDIFWGRIPVRRRFANSVNDGNYEYRQQRIEEEYIRGYVCYIKMKDVKEPFIVQDGDTSVCLLDENYVWIEVYPDNENYAMTIMYDDKNNLIEWYFDIAKEVGVEEGIPYEDDLYLDLLIKPNGDSIILDEDELKSAFDNGMITKDDVDLAYNTLSKLQSKYVNDVDFLVELTRRIYKFIL